MMSERTQAKNNPTATQQPPPEQRKSNLGSRLPAAPSRYPIMRQPDFEGEVRLRIGGSLARSYRIFYGFFSCISLATTVFSALCVGTATSPELALVAFSSVGTVLCSACFGSTFSRRRARHRSQENFSDVLGAVERLFRQESLSDAELKFAFSTYERVVAHSPKGIDLVRVTAGFQNISRHVPIEQRLSLLASIACCKDYALEYRGLVFGELTKTLLATLPLDFVPNRELALAVARLSSAMAGASLYDLRREDRAKLSVALFEFARMCPPHEGSQILHSLTWIVPRNHLVRGNIEELLADKERAPQETPEGRK